MNGATRERGAAELQTKAQAETLKTQEAVTGAEAVTALIAVHSVQCGWQGRDRWSSQSVKRMLTAPPIRVMPPEVMVQNVRNGSSRAPLS